MFLGLLKNLSLKKTVKKSLSKVQPPSGNRITTVNLLIDGIRFNETAKLIEELVKNGIRKENIKALVLTKNKTAVDSDVITYFRSKDISLGGAILKEEVNSFINRKSDLLVNYYQYKQIDLEYITMKSVADFKAGFVTNGLSAYHLSIDCSFSDYRLFTEELFKYLKAFNKI